MLVVVEVWVQVLKVQVELGPHHADEPFPVAHTIKLCKEFLSAGAFKICLEGEVIHVMKPWENPDSAEKLMAIIDAVGMDNLVFETGMRPPQAVQWFADRINHTSHELIQIEHIRRGMNYSDTWFGKFVSL